MGTIRVTVPIHTRVYEEHTIEVDDVHGLDEDEVRQLVEARTAAPSIDMDYYERQFDELTFECTHLNFEVQGEATELEGCVVDLLCRDCGTSGSCTINPEDIQW